MSALRLLLRRFASGALTNNFDNVSTFPAQIVDYVEKCIAREFTSTQRHVLQTFVTECLLRGTANEEEEYTYNDSSGDQVISSHTFVMNDKEFVQELTAYINEQIEGISNADDVFRLPSGSGGQGKGGKGPGKHREGTAQAAELVDLYNKHVEYLREINLQSACIAFGEDYDAFLHNISEMFPDEDYADYS